METKHNVNKNMQGLETQVTELGAATELTLGFSGKIIEGKRGRWGDLWRSGMEVEQVTELGTATELTLGYGGDAHEGMKRYVRKLTC